MNWYSNISLGRGMAPWFKEDAPKIICFAQIHEYCTPKRSDCYEHGVLNHMYTNKYICINVCTCITIIKKYFLTQKIILKYCYCTHNIMILYWMDHNKYFQNNFGLHSQYCFLCYQQTCISPDQQYRVKPSCIAFQQI